MNGTTTTSTGRSVQLAVMAAPTTSLAQAVANARRGEPAALWTALERSGRARQLAISPAWG
jgi:hypothetical protein